MIPKVKTWRISFFYYRTSAKPYAVIYIDAPTKLLARLNVLHDADTAGTYFSAMKEQPRKITYGIVRTKKEQ